MRWSEARSGSTAVSPLCSRYRLDVDRSKHQVNQAILGPYSGIPTSLPSRWKSDVDTRPLLEAPLEERRGWHLNVVDAVAESRKITRDGQRPPLLLLLVAKVHGGMGPDLTTGEEEAVSGGARHLGAA